MLFIITHIFCDKHSDRKQQKCTKMHCTHVRKFLEGLPKNQQVLFEETARSVSLPYIAEFQLDLRGLGERFTCFLTIESKTALRLIIYKLC